MSPSPARLRLSRARGFNLQTHSLATNGLPAVVVARPTKWGNPWSICQHAQSGRWLVNGPGVPIGGHWCGNEEGARLVAVRQFRRRVEHDGIAAHLLRGRNLACWCGEGPCHADVLLKLAAEAPAPSVPTPSSTEVA